MMTSSLGFVVLTASFLLASAPSVICQNIFDTSGGKFFYHTKEKPKGVQIINTDNLPIDFFLASSAIKIITHGYMANKNQCQTIVNNYLTHTDTTVLSFDWSESSSVPEIEAAVLAVAFGSTSVNHFISMLRNKHNIKPDQFHLIGYGMGAHMMGAAGRAHQGKLARISGLDPSKKYFDGNSEINLPKLSATDAVVVDIYHTDAGRLGIDEPIGTVDFYPGGGNYQPKCFEYNSQNCDSLMSIEYYAESIRSGGSFMGRECRSFEEFIRRRCNKNPIAIAGEFLSTDASGTYYFQTNIGPPYGRKQNGTIPSHILLY